jgi:hypothetical protein
MSVNATQRQVLKERAFWIKSTRVPTSFICQFRSKNKVAKRLEGLVSKVMQLHCQKLAVFFDRNN